MMQLGKGIGKGKNHNMAGHSMASSVLNRFNLFIKNIYLDYYEVFKEIRISARNKPLKASFYAGTTLFILNLFRTNEDLKSYRSEVITACNRLGSVPENSRNPKSWKFVETVGELNGHSLLRQVDFGFTTLIYKSDTNPETALFRYNCKHLNPSVKEFFQNRLIDLGVLGHWLILETNMQDYDVNDQTVID